MKKRLPKLKSDKAARRLLAGDLADYLAPTHFTRTTFEFAPKDERITLRVSKGLHKAIREAAADRQMHYQRLIREAIEHFLKRGRAA